MSYNGKNYAEQGGDKWVIGGTLEIKEGASVTGLPAAEVPQVANQADSVATDVPTLVSDFNGLLAKLKAAGLMTAD
ncbi:head fiber protein [Ruminococcus bromii]|uniref:head fiber protein n=1 Tax=Ruminococcus bromii TaxID=40518 RepID=UPI0029306F22|nr:head fiber protein [Ruminococcus bromii]MDE8725930.1 head fiber protein [Ruminococcus bromii]